HVAILDDGLVHNLAQHRGRGLKLGDVGGVGGDLAGHLEQRRGRPVDVLDGADEHRQQGCDGERGDQRDDERDTPGPVVGERVDGHLPTATLRSARAECRIRTPESLIWPMPLRASVWERTTSTPSTAPAACLAILVARATMVMTIAAATITTTMPRISPMVQPLE